MSSKRTFGKKSSTNSSNNPLLSIRFSKHDEELEVYEATEQKEAASIPGTSKTESDISFSTFTSTEDDKIKSVNGEDNRKDFSNVSKTSSQLESEVLAEKVKPLLRERSPAKSPAKLGRQAYSLDLEDNSAEGDSWNFLKDIKGKIVKNIEECIHKDVKGGIVEGEIIKPLEEVMAEDNVATLSSIALDDGSTEKDVAEHVSPSIEATEDFGELFSSDCHVEIVKSTAQGTPKNNFSTPQKKKKDSPKTEFNMKLSALMASRSFSLEDDPSASKDKPDRIISESSELETPTSVVKTPASSTPSSSSVWYIFKLLIHLLQGFWTMSWKMNGAIAATTFCIRLVMPSFLFWFFLGGAVSAFLIFWLTRPAVKKPQFQIPDYKNMPSLTIPEFDTTFDTTVFKGWMNELPSEYDPDMYHVSSTHSVYLRLDGSSLRVSYPKINIPKRAMYNEKRHELASLYPRHHDLTGASVELLPKELPKKRLWSKKYPICLKFTDSQHNISFSSKQRISKAQGSKESSPSKKYEPKVNGHGEIVMYLFARTDRDKDDWYRRFLKASRIKMLKSHSPTSSPNIACLENTVPVNRRPVSVDLGSLQTSASMSSLPLLEDQEIGDDEAFDEIEFDKHQKFEFYMTQLLSKSTDPSLARKKVPFKERNTSPSLKSAQSPQDLIWLNTLLGRLFFDFFTEDMWADLVSERIQRKLSKIKLPNFIEELKITDLNLGSVLPKIHRTSAPSVDHRGLWVDIDVSYNGHFQMTLETKLNLFKLQKSEGLFTSVKDKELEEILSSTPHQYGSDEEDSAESSSDDDVPLPELKLSTSFDESPTSAAASGGGISSSASKKLIRLVDKIAQSAYFQSATKNKYIKRAMTEVSNTPLVLTVEIHWLTGTLAINIPPMPTDRLWYGFRKNPELCIEARPKLGCRAVKVTHITEWIEQKLVLEFQKVLVMPNMDDLYIPIMHSDLQISPR